MSATVAKTAGGTGIPYQTIKCGDNQRISVGASSTQSSTFNSKTSLVRIFPTADMWCAFGTNPTAAANDGASTFVPGGIIQWFIVEPSSKIAAIRDSTSGQLHILEAKAV